MPPVHRILFRVLWEIQSTGLYSWRTFSLVLGKKPGLDLGHWHSEDTDIVRQGRCLLHVPPSCCSSSTMRYWFLHGSLTSGESSQCSQAAELPLVLVRQRFFSSPYHFPDQPPRTCGSVQFTPRRFWAPRWHSAPERVERHGGTNPQGSEHMVQGGLWCHLSCFWMWELVAPKNRNNGYWIGTSVVL